MIIILQTYARTAYALATIRAIKERLDYPARWLVVDDGSPIDHLKALETEIGFDMISLYSSRIGYGALANIAWRESAKHDPVTMWLEDDWVLDRPFNPSHYEQALINQSDVGMIRLGRIPVGLQGQIVGDGAQVYLKLQKGPAYYFSGNPSLRHNRFHQAYGDYPTGLKPGDTEVAYDTRVQQRKGPDILIPIDIGTWGLFGHIGAERSY